MLPKPNFKVLLLFPRYFSRYASPKLCECKPDCPKTFKNCDTVQEEICEQCSFKTWKPKSPELLQKNLTDSKPKRNLIKQCVAAMGTVRTKCVEDEKCDNKIVKKGDEEIPKSNWTYECKK